jgi:hypothetical protein
MVEVGVRIFAAASQGPAGGDHLVGQGGPLARITPVDAVILAFKLSEPNHHHGGGGRVLEKGIGEELAGHNRGALG